MLPTTLALIDDDRECSALLAQYRRQQGIQVDVYADSNLLLGQAEPCRYGFYIVDLLLPGVDGVKLIKLLRQCGRAGILVVSGRSAAAVCKQNRWRWPFWPCSGGRPRRNRRPCRPGCCTATSAVWPPRRGPWWT